MSDASKYDLLKHLRLSADISVPTLADLYALQTFRRKWGVSVYVYEDGANTGTYRLIKGHSSDNPQDNLNWVKDTGGGGYEPKNSIEVDADELQLVGDEDDPGNSKYYGTDEAGEKGYHTLPAGGASLPRYGTLINFDTYDDLSVKRTKTEYPESKFIETRIQYHDSGDEIGQPEFMEVKDDLSSEWYKITFNYTDGKLNVTNATTLTVIAAWTITV